MFSVQRSFGPADGGILLTELKKNKTKKQECNRDMFAENFLYLCQLFKDNDEVQYDFLRAFVAFHFVTWKKGRNDMQQKICNRINQNFNGTGQKKSKNYRNRRPLPVP